MIKYIYIKLFFILSSILVANTALDITQLPNSATELRKSQILGFTNHSAVIFENPASISNIKFDSISLFSSYIMQGESKLESISMNFPIFNGHFAIGYKSHAVDSLIKTEQLIQYSDGFIYPSIAGTFNYQDDIIKLAYSLKLKNKHIGINISQFKYKMDTVTGKAYNIDLGVLFNHEKFQSSIVINNALKDYAQMKYTNSADENSDDVSYILPQRFVYSIKYPLNKFSVYAQLQSRLLSNKYSDNLFTKVQPAIAIEYPILQYPKIVVSAGFSKQDLHLAETKKYNLGIGLETATIGCDISYEKSDYKINPNHLFFSIYVKNIKDEIFKNRKQYIESIDFDNIKKTKMVKKYPETKINLSRNHWVYQSYKNIQSYQILSPSFFKLKDSDHISLDNAVKLIYVAYISKIYNTEFEIPYIIKGEKSQYMVSSSIKSKNKNKIIIENNQIKKIGKNKIVWNQLNEQNKYVNEGEYEIEITILNKQRYKNKIYTLPVNIIDTKQNLNKKINVFYKNLNKDMLIQLIDNKGNISRITFISIISEFIKNEFPESIDIVKSIPLKYQDCKNLDKRKSTLLKLYQYYLDPHPNIKTIRPNDIITNAEAVAIVDRYIKRFTLNTN